MEAIEEGHRRGFRLADQRNWMAVKAPGAGVMDEIEGIYVEYRQAGPPPWDSAAFAAASFFLRSSSFLRRV